MKWRERRTKGNAKSEKINGKGKTEEDIEGDGRWSDEKGEKGRWNEKREEEMEEEVRGMKGRENGEGIRDGERDMGKRGGNRRRSGNREKVIKDMQRGKRIDGKR